MKSLWYMVGRHFGPRRIRHVAMTVFVLFTLLGSTLLIAGQSPNFIEWASEDRQQVVVSVPDDTDGDGLPDALENIIGSDPERYDTLGQGVADGWIYYWFGAGVDWEENPFLDSPALVAPHDVLPGPLSRQGGVSTPTIAEVYHLETQRMKEEGMSGVWWLVEPGLNPLKWDNTGDGVADAWLLQHGLHPLEADVDGPAPGDEAMTIREKYVNGLDPTSRDTSGNGLLDVEALTGRADFPDGVREFDPLKPHVFSSRGDGIADGYLVYFGLDSEDEDVASATPAGDGVTVQEAYMATLHHCVQSGPEGTLEPDLEPFAEDGSYCDWRKRLEEGPLVDPTFWDSLGDGVPDAWSLRDPHNIAQPLVDARSVVRYTTEEWDTTVWTGDLDDLFGVLVEEQNPQPGTPFEVTLFDLYTYERPGKWNEETMGPWWGGLPTVIDTPEGGLPPAVALRGWSIEIDVGLGGRTDFRMINASSDPRMSDTSGDGLLDVWEYYGVGFGEDGTPIGFSRTDPSSPDTDGDGLTDFEEVFVYNTNPVARDTSGSFLTDGYEMDYWTKRYEEAVGMFETNRTRAMKEFGWLAPDDQVTTQDIERLRPTGILHGDTPNILSASSSGDGLKDGQELYPNSYLDMPTAQVRPATDPARLDTDGDRLPDEWEVIWSPDQVFDCRGPCEPPVGDVSGWPLDPAQKLSVAVPGADSDAEVNLAGDDVRTAPRDTEPFSNWIAYRYDLNPFERDTSGDGIYDMFAIWWGVENVPEAVEQIVEEEGVEWALQAANEWTSRLTERGRDALSTDVVVIHPDPPSGSPSEVTTETNLLEKFSGREKGTWIYVPPSEQETGVDCETETFPEQGPRREAGYPGWTGAQNVPERTGVNAVVDFGDSENAACWRWVEHPLREDLDQSSPWRHDFAGDGIPDAWRFHYAEKAGLDPWSIHPDAPTPGSLEADCENPAITDGWVLPDGWSSFCLTWMQSYQFGLDPLTRDTDEGGLPDWQEIVLGLNPLDPSDDHADQDWSGDGLPNFVKLSLGLNIMSPDTSRSGLLDGDLHALFTNEEDLQPYQHLQDGKGEGDLCVRRGSDFVPGMENRPVPAEEGNEDGRLTWDELFDWYVDLGILYLVHPDDDRSTPLKSHPACRNMEAVEDSDGNELPWILFLREGAWDPERQEFLGAGRGTDPHAWDTSGDGIPDGWLVYWREQAIAEGRGSATLAALNPRTNVADDDPDGDLVSNIEEYRRSRPDDWIESRDGAWWGGSSPIHLATSGAEDWFVQARHADDSRNTDLDSDGIPDRYDPFPAIDSGNKGIVQWDPECVIEGGAEKGCYTTDYQSLWHALETREDAPVRDSDGDRVPDFLDRAKVRFELDVTGSLELVQGGDPLNISGRLVLDEPEPPDFSPGDWVIARTPSHPHWNQWAADGWGVEGVTVKAYLEDGEGNKALVGFNFTGDGGSFTIEAIAGPDLATPEPPAAGAAVEGRVYSDGSGPIRLDGEGHKLVPGEGVRLVLEAEANDAGIQPLQFTQDGNTRTHAGAYKETPFVVPGRDIQLGDERREVEVRAVYLNAIGRGPDFNVGRVFHSTGAVFENQSEPLPLMLTSRTQLDIAQVDDVLTGEDFEVTGRLVNEAGTGIADRWVLAELLGGQTTPVEAETGGDGRFEFVIPASGLAPGDRAIRIGVVDWPDEGVLNEPDPVTVSARLVQETLWEAVRVDNASLPVTRVVETDAAEPVLVSARLVDHRGGPLPGQDAELIIESIRDGVVERLSSTTGEDGVVEFVVPPLPKDLALGHLEMRLKAIAGPHDMHESEQWLMEPRFHVELRVSGTTISVGQTGTLEVRLLRAGGPPVEDSGAGFIVRSSDGEVTTFTGTDEHGGFEIPVNRPDPGNVTWTVQFVGTDTLYPSDPVAVESAHTSATQFAGISGEGIRGHPVVVSGALLLADGREVPGDQTVRARWADDDPAHAVEWTTTSGNFTGHLPERDTTGPHGLVLHFPGTTHLHSSDSRAAVEVFAPTLLVMNVTNITVPVETEAEPAFVSTALFEVQVDEEEVPLGGRTVNFLFEGPHGGIVEWDVVTDPDGTVSLHAHDIGLFVPGPWNVKADYAGSQARHEAPAEAEGNVTLHHGARVVLDRTPSTLMPGSLARIDGRVLAPTNATGPFNLAASLDGEILAETRTDPGGPFSLQIEAPDHIRGKVALVVFAEPLAYHEIDEVSVEVTVLSPIQVHLEQETLRDGTRRITVQVEAPDGWEGGEVVLVRKRDDGSTASVYTVGVDARGRTTIELGPEQRGEVAVATVIADGFRVTDPAMLPAVAGVTVGEEETSWWTILLGVLALIAVIGLLGSYLWWRHVQADILRRAWQEALTALYDPEKSPTLVVREAYHQLLEALGRTGYDPTKRTVRDVTEEATQFFQLPYGPMQTLAALFERVTYARAELAPEDRHPAITAFETLYAQIPDPLRRKLSPKTIDPPRRFYHVKHDA